MARRLYDPEEVLDILVNDDPESLLEPICDGSDDDLGFSEESDNEQVSFYKS